MNKTDDFVSVNVPSEFIDDFYKVIEMGLERAKIKAAIRKSMKEWWECERCYIKE